MFKQIRFRIIATILFATFITLMIIGTLSFYIAEKTVYNSNSDVVSENSNQSAKMIDEYMKLISVNFKGANFNNQLALDIIVNGKISESTAERIDLYCSACTGFSEYALLSSDKSILYTNHADDSKQIYADIDTAKFVNKRPLKDNIFVFISDLTDSDFNIIIPVFYNNDLCGFQLIRIDGSELHHMLKSQYSSFGTTEWHCFIDIDGNFVSFDEEAAFDTQKYAEDFEYMPARTFDRKFFAVKAQTSCGLAFVTLLSAEDYANSLSEMLIFLVLIALTLLVIAFVIATIFAEGITKPLTSLYNKIQKAAQANTVHEDDTDKNKTEASTKN